MRKLTHSILFSFVLLITALLSCAVYGFGLFHTVQEKMTDRLFLNKAPSSEVVVIAVDDASLNKIGQWPWERSVFARALDVLQMNPSEKPKAVGIDVSFSEPSRSGEKDDVLFQKALQSLKEQNIPVVLPIDLDETSSLASGPIESLRAVTEQGFINFPLDGDGVVRNVERVRGEYKSFSSLLVPVSAPDSYRIDYRGTNGFLTVSFTDVLEGRVPSRIWKDKIVLIGVTAPNLHDFVATPFNQMPGVLANANAIDTLLQGRFFKNLAFPIGYALIALLVLLVGLCVKQIQKMTALFGALLGLLIAVAVATSIAFGTFLILPIFYLLFAFVFSTIVFLAFGYITTAKEKAFIKNSFQYYLTPQVIDELIKHPEKLSLGGESKRMTILFSDIRGFTTISEKLSPEELTQLLNEYLTAMTDIIMEHHGVVDKYIGDAIMAFWGAPLENENQESDACKSSIAMMKKLQELNKRWKTPLAIGIGMNTGNVVVGNMGSRKRFNYTVMGDEVNLASRLESLTKYYRTSILVSEQTRAAFSASKEIWFRELDQIVVKGKQDPTKIFEVLLKKPNQKEQDAHKYFEQGRLAYTKGNWDAAIRKFEKAIELTNDGPSQLFLERSANLKLHPPKGWDGVYSFDQK
jgi:adenylate cyclase